MPTNTAAWITAPHASPLEVKQSPYPSPGPKDVIIQTAYVAINPLDFKVQDSNPPVGGKEIKYPTILGSDVAGTVVEAGPDVSSVKAGSRVIANAHGLARGEPAKSGFQKYVLLPEIAVTPLPDNVSFEAGAVLPLACATAAAGLFVPGTVGLSTAKLGDANAQPPAPGSAILIWGGSSSVGCCAIQMAKAAGYEVLTTASKRNHDLCTSIGAEQAFDHSAPDVESSIASALKGKTVIGALDCIADGDKTILACARILAQAEGQKKVMTVLSPPQEEFEGVKAQRRKRPASHHQRKSQLTFQSQSSSPTSTAARPTRPSTPGSPRPWPMGR
jgi:NADPH:quinone reductase-like Zn-dependent oxidoreductase